MSGIKVYWKGSTPYVQRKLPKHLLEGCSEDVRLNVLGVKSKTLKAYLTAKDKPVNAQAAEVWSRWEAQFSELERQMTGQSVKVAPEPLSQEERDRRLAVVLQDAFENARDALRQDLDEARLTFEADDEHPTFEDWASDHATTAYGEDARTLLQEGTLSPVLEARYLKLLKAEGLGADSYQATKADFIKLAEQELAGYSTALGRYSAQAERQARRFEKHREEVLGELGIALPKLSNTVERTPNGVGKCKLDACLQAWIKDRPRPEKTISEWRRAVALMHEIVGEKPMAEYTKDDVRRFRSGLKSMPKHSSQKWPGLSADKIIEQTEGDESLERLSAASV